MFEIEFYKGSEGDVRPKLINLDAIAELTDKTLALVTGATYELTPESAKALYEEIAPKKKPASKKSSPKKAEEKEGPNHSRIAQEHQAKAKADGKEPGAGCIEQLSMGEAVDGHAGDGTQPQHGNGPDQIERAQHGPGRCQVVDQPAQGHLLNPLRGIAERSAAQKPGETGVA